ncbi:DUF4352 domain-containing protein [Actinocorallia lasiicapitis]
MPQPKQSKGKGCLLTAVIATAVVLVLIVIAVASLGGGGGDDTGAGAKKKATAAGIGQEARDGKFAFTVTKVKTGVKKVGNQYLNKKAQGSFVLVYVTVKNIGTKAQSFSGDEQKLFDTAKREYSADTEAAIYLDNSKSLYEEINPGNAVKGIVLFDLPAGATPSRLELHDSFLSGGVTVTLK